MIEKKRKIFGAVLGRGAEETKRALSIGGIPQVVRLVAHVTSLCNMTCRYCSNRKKNSQIMTQELFRSLIQRAGPQGVVHITGGEPSLVPWLEKEIQGQKGNTRFAWNSNLLIMPQDKTLESLFRVKTSLDDCHADRWNELTGGDHFDRVVENIKRCCQALSHVSVSFCATHQNAFRFDNFIRFCQTEFPGLFSISASFYKGKNKSLILTRDDVDQLFFYANELDPVSQQIFKTTHYRGGNNFPHNIEIPCYLSMTERLYDEWGDEYYCSHLFRDKVAPPGNPGKDSHCVTGCNYRFVKYNKEIHEYLSKGRHVEEMLSEKVSEED